MRTITIEGKEYKVFEISMFDEKYEITLTSERYNTDDSLAVIAWTVEDDEIADMWADVTVWIHPLSNESPVAYVDTNNGSSWSIIDFLEGNKIAKSTGMTASSGFCTYPLYEFDMSMLTPGE